MDENTKPNNYSMNESVKLYGLLLQNNIEPTRITTIQEGGICFVIHNLPYIIYMIVYNDKELGLVIENIRDKKIIKNMEIDMLDDFIKEMI